jgi:H+-transporting ATPase
MLNKVSWLDNLGRATRSKKNEKLENFLTDLQRLTIVHESDHDGGSHFRFAAGADSGNPKEPSSEDEKPKKGKTDTDKSNGNSTTSGSSASSGKTKGKGKEEEEGESDKLPGTSGGGAEEGDKTLADDHGKGREMEQHKKNEEHGDSPHMTDDEGNSSDHTKVDRHERRSEDVGGR